MFQIYEVGGSVSLLETATTVGFLRSMKKPTATGIRIKIIERHRRTKPIVGERVPELATPLSSVVYGILPVAVTAPKIHMNKPGHPHNTTDTIVATIPFVFVSIFFSPLMK